MKGINDSSLKILRWLDFYVADTVDIQKKRVICVCDIVERMPKFCIGQKA